MHLKIAKIRELCIGGTAVPPVYTKLSYFSDFQKRTMPLRLNH